MRLTLLTSVLLTVALVSVRGAPACHNDVECGTGGYPNFACVIDKCAERLVSGTDFEVHFPKPGQGAANALNAGILTDGSLATVVQTFGLDVMFNFTVPTTLARVNLDLDTSNHSPTVACKYMSTADVWTTDTNTGDFSGIPAQARWTNELQFDAAILYTHVWCHLVTGINNNFGFKEMTAFSIPENGTCSSSASCLNYPSELCDNNDEQCLTGDSNAASIYFAEGSCVPCDAGTMQDGIIGTPCGGGVVTLSICNINFQVTAGYQFEAVTIDFFESNENPFPIGCQYMDGATAHDFGVQDLEKVDNNKWRFVAFQSLPPTIVDFTCSIQNSMATTLKISEVTVYTNPETETTEAPACNCADPYPESYCFEGVCQTKIYVATVEEVACNELDITRLDDTDMGTNILLTPGSACQFAFVFDGSHTGFNGYLALDFDDANGIQSVECEAKDYACNKTTVPMSKTSPTSYQSDERISDSVGMRCTVHSAANIHFQEATLFGVSLMDANNCPTNGPQCDCAVYPTELCILETAECLSRIDEGTDFHLIPGTGCDTFDFNALRDGNLGTAGAMFSASSSCQFSFEFGDLPAVTGFNGHLTLDFLDASGLSSLNCDYFDYEDPNAKPALMSNSDAPNTYRSHKLRNATVVRCLVQVAAATSLAETSLFGEKLFYGTGDIETTDAPNDCDCPSQYPHHFCVANECLPKIPSNDYSLVLEQSEVSVPDEDLAFLSDANLNTVAYLSASTEYLLAVDFGVNGRTSFDGYIVLDFGSTVSDITTMDCTYNGGTPLPMDNMDTYFVNHNKIAPGSSVRCNIAGNPGPSFGEVSIFESAGSPPEQCLGCEQYPGGWCDSDDCYPKIDTSDWEFSLDCSNGYVPNNLGYITDGDTGNGAFFENDNIDCTVTAELTTEGITAFFGFFILDFDDRFDVDSCEYVRKDGGDAENVAMLPQTGDMFVNGAPLENAELVECDIHTTGSGAYFSEFTLFGSTVDCCDNDYPSRYCYVSTCLNSLDPDVDGGDDYALTLNMEGTAQIDIGDIADSDLDTSFKLYSDYEYEIEAAMPSGVKLVGLIVLHFDESPEYFAGSPVVCKYCDTQALCDDAQGLALTADNGKFRSAYVSDGFASVSCVVNPPDSGGSVELQEFTLFGSTVDCCSNDYPERYCYESTCLNSLVSYVTGGDDSDFQLILSLEETRQSDIEDITDGDVSTSVELSAGDEYEIEAIIHSGNQFTGVVVLDFDESPEEVGCQFCSEEVDCDNSDEMILTEDGGGQYSSEYLEEIVSVACVVTVPDSDSVEFQEFSLFGTVNATKEGGDGEGKGDDSALGKGAERTFTMFILGMVFGMLLTMVAAYIFEWECCYAALSGWVLKVEGTKSGSVQLFALQVWDLYTDANLSLALWASSEAAAIFKYLSTGFVVFPYLLSFAAAMYMGTLLRKCAPSNLVAIRNFTGVTKAFMFTVAVSGGFHAAVNLFNSRLFGLPMFSMGLTDGELRKFDPFKVYLTVMFENLPQLILQLFILTVGNTKIGFALYMSMMSSILSIVVSVTSYAAEGCAKLEEHTLVVSVSLGHKESADVHEIALINDAVEAHARCYLSLGDAVARALEVDCDALNAGWIQVTSSAANTTMRVYCGISTSADEEYDTEALRKIFAVAVAKGNFEKDFMHSFQLSKADKDKYDFSVEIDFYEIDPKTKRVASVSNVGTGIELGRVRTMTSPRSPRAKGVATDGGGEGVRGAFSFEGEGHFETGDDGKAVARPQGVSAPPEAYPALGEVQTVASAAAADGMGLRTDEIAAAAPVPFTGA